MKHKKLCIWSLISNKLNSSYFLFPEQHSPPTNSKNLRELLNVRHIQTYLHAKNSLWSSTWASREFRVSFQLFVQKILLLLTLNNLILYNQIKIIFSVVPKSSRKMAQTWATAKNGLHQHEQLTIDTNHRSGNPHIAGFRHIPAADYCYTAEW